MKYMEFSIQKVVIANWLLLLFLCIGGVIFATPYITTSILVGGTIANLSFGQLKKDLTKLFSGSLQGIKARFFVRYYLRLSVLVALLFILVKMHTVDILGLLIGLSTVFLGILITLIFETKKIYFNNMKEAS